MPTKVQRWGNSLGLRIPKPLAEQAGLEAGSEVDLTVEEGSLIARPRRPARCDLASLLAKVTTKNRHDEVESGEPVGRESW